MNASPASSVVCLRHAEAQINVDRYFSSAIPGTPLTERGRQQANAAAGSLSGDKVAAVYASPVLRARQTGEIVAATLGVPLELLDGLREVGMGAREETPGTNSEFFHHASFQAWLHGTDLDASFEGGETGREVMARMRDALEEVATNHPGQTVVVVSHGGSLLAGLLGLCEDLAYADVMHGVPANGASIRLERRDNVWSCASWPTPR
jgi:2,3-bisphosphoglycerate-dependent phosphoglycerate mutase